MRWIALLAVAVLWLAGAWLAPHDGTPWRDEVQYHLPTIQQFAHNLPRVDLSEYDAASTPGYHLVLAGMLRLVGHDFVLIIGNVAFSVACLAAAMWVIGRGTKWGWLLAMSLLFSPYFQYGALWLRPDNAAWLVVFVILGLAMQERFGRRHMLIGAGLLVMLVIFRHAHIWAAACLWMAAALPEGPPVRFTTLRWKRALSMFALTLPAFVIVGWFIWLWGGMVPPRFQSHPEGLPVDHSGWQHEGPNFSVPMFILALFGFIGLLALPFVWRPLARGRRAWRGAIIGVAIALPLALLVPSNWDETQGRRSGLWNAAQQLPAPHDRSVLLVPLALIGGALVGWFLASLPPRPRWVVLTTLAAFTAAQTANAMAWQKYYEPLVIVVVGSMVLQIWCRSANGGLAVERESKAPHANASSQALTR